MAVAGALAWAGAGGCVGSGSFLNENDRLRAENQKLKDQVETKSGQITSLQRQLLVEQSRQKLKLPEGVVRPVAVKVHIGRYSRGLDQDKDGHDDAIRIYLKILDAQERFVLSVGNLEMTVVKIAPGADAVTVGKRSLDAKAFDQTYRSSLTGTHHTVVCPVDKSLIPKDTKQLTVRVSFLDLSTGSSFEHEAIVDWKP